MNENSMEIVNFLDTFLAAFFSEDEPIYIRAFKAKGAPDSPTNSPRKFSVNRAQLKSDPSLYASLRELNRDRGLYFVVNAGGQTKASINRINAFFAESDNLSKEDQHRLLNIAPIKPSIRVETLKSVHAYWLVDGPCSVEEWEKFQLTVIDYLSSIGLRADASIKDASRVMRLPGFDHLSHQSESGECERLAVKLVEFEPQKRHTLAAMKKAFAKAANSNFEVGHNRELPNQILDGEGRTREILSLAGSLNARGMTSQEMLEMLQVVNQRRCEPPLTDEKIHSIVNSVCNYESANPIGNQRKTEHRTDLGNARRLIHVYGRDLRFDSDRAIWLAWNGDKWVEDSEADAMRLAKEVPASIVAEAASLKDEKDRNELFKHAMKSESATALAAMLKLAKSEREIAASVDDFDSHHHLLNVANGTIDLRSGMLQEHRREDMCTKMVPIIYDARARAPLFHRFMERIFDGQKPLIEFIQRACGYSLSGETGEQCMFMLHGTGANGKSTFLEILAAVTGEYSAHVRTEALMKHKNTSAGAASEDIAELRGARFVSCIETEVGQTLAEGLLKSITGQDRIKARKLYGHNVEFTPAFKLFLACNDKPVIGGTGDNSIWRRIHLIPFNVTIPEKERQRRILSDLKGELPGILAWCVSGAQEFYKQGLNVPAEVKAATEQYKAEEDTLSEFMSDALEVGEGLTISVGELYSEYLLWCRVQNAPLDERKVFNSKMKTRGFEQTRVHAGRIWRGLSRRSMTLTQAEDHTPETVSIM